MKKLILSLLILVSTSILSFSQAIAKGNITAEVVSAATVTVPMIQSHISNTDSNVSHIDYDVIINIVIIYGEEKIVVEYIIIIYN